MILSAARRLVLGRKPARFVPYDMFDHERTARELKSATTMERIYHKGQERAWDGKAVLAELLEEHGGVQLERERLEPLRRLFAVIFWGELAAWKVSAELALEIEPLEAKMAASSQAHDEARHFYVLHDYLSLLDYRPSDLPPAANRILHNILTADSLAKKLVGMQLMVEPIALTLFQLVRQNRLEPVLADLLAYYERDEARHIALGVNYLPQLIARMGRRDLVDFYAWQVRMFMIELDGVREMSEDFRALGFEPSEVVRLGQLKQLHASRLVSAQMEDKVPFEAILTRAIEFRMALDFPEDPSSGRLQRWQGALDALLHSSAASRAVQEELDGIAPGEMFGPSCGS